MGSSYSREYLSIYEVNTPLIAICFTSLLFNSMHNGLFRVANFYSNLFISYSLCISTGCSSYLHEPLLGAKLGFFAALFFTLGPYLKLVYTQRLFPNYVRNGIGSFYLTYHSLQWYKAKYHIEDAHEDFEEEDY
ncbi:unnamed protein product [Phytomonas sp. Hart1]|nr:unnamed protein product [Phytomonas sp. Hart1]|eukprot:CCW70695.1 unnamed protein product [Phytomonas sp. isolate Hart1]